AGGQPGGGDAGATVRFTFQPGQEADRVFRFGAGRGTPCGVPGGPDLAPELAPGGSPGHRCGAAGRGTADAGAVTSGFRRPLAAHDGTGPLPGQLPAATTALAAGF